MGGVSTESTHLLQCFQPYRRGQTAEELADIVKTATSNPDGNGWYLFAVNQLRQILNAYVHSESFDPKVEKKNRNNWQ